jgi:tryptophan 2,3-dioxygenase
MSTNPLSSKHSYRQKYFAMLDAPEILDYGTYLNCDRLLDCQKPLDELCNADELQFQIIHQVE